MGSLEAEERKYVLVQERVARMEPPEAARLTARYLDTSPATQFANRLESEFPEVVAEARKMRKREDAALIADTELIEMLGFPAEVDEEFNAELNSRLAALAEEIKDVERVVRRALRSGNPDAELVAAALAVRHGLSDFASMLAAKVVVGHPHAPQAAAFAAKLSPELARDVFSRFLVDVLYDDTPQEEKIDEALIRRALAAARRVLPFTKSPIPAVKYTSPDAQEAAELASRAWNLQPLPTTPH